MADQTTLQNDAMFKYEFLNDIRNDKYYPPGTWERGVDILVRLCAAFERDKPMDAAGVFGLTHAATEEFNAMLDDEIDLETVARECIAADIMAILAAYGHGTLDIEEAIAPRDW
jgi:hypothetical protein